MCAGSSFGEAGKLYIVIVALCTWYKRKGLNMGIEIDFRLEAVEIFSRREELPPLG